MAKIPVIATVSRAYGFLLGEVGTIVRLAWAPLAVGAAVSYYYGGQVMDGAIDSAKDPSRAMEYLGLNFIVSAVGFVTLVIAMVALLRIVIFGDRKPGLFIYLWLGAAELRLILVYALLVVAAIAALVAAGLVFGLLAALSAAFPALSVLLVIGMFALVIATIWVSLRLSLVPSVVVAENSLGVERSWELSRGNALRLFGVLFLTFVPYAIAITLVALALIGGDMPALPPFPSVGEGSAAAAASEAYAKAMEEWQLGLFKAMRARWLEFSVLGFVANLVSTALFAGSLGSAYTAVAGARSA